jgi:hypothetical protein
MKQNLSTSIVASYGDPQMKASFQISISKMVIC